MYVLKVELKVDASSHDHIKKISTHFLKPQNCAEPRGDQHSPAILHSCVDLSFGVEEIRISDAVQYCFWIRFRCADFR